jgi:hypothetical protein
MVGETFNRAEPILLPLLGVRFEEGNLLSLPVSQPYASVSISMSILVSEESLRGMGGSLLL